MLHIDELKDVNNVNLVVFDVDGVIIPFGAGVIEDGEKIIYHLKHPSNEFVEMVKELLKYTNVAISSGRNMLVLKTMFNELLAHEVNGHKFMIQAESGGRISCGCEEISSTKDPSLMRQLSEIKSRLRKINHPAITGFEPKESVITMYSSERVQEVEDLLNEYPHRIFFTGETYEVCQKGVDKGSGIDIMKDLIRENMDEDFLTVAIGDRENDLPMLEKADITVSADPDSIKNAQYYIDTVEKSSRLPGEVLAEKLLGLFRKG
jgi:hydroxymethylpyrimidine pyrophosphatase-like HAD family hydrolase